MDYTIEVTDDELPLLRAALHSYLDDFGHEEADVLRRIQGLIAKLPEGDASSRRHAHHSTATRRTTSRTRSSELRLTHSTTA